MLAGEYLETEFPQESLDDLINNLDLEEKMDDSIQVLEDELNNLTWHNYKHDLEELDEEYDPVSHREETIMSLPMGPMDSQDNLNHSSHDNVQDTHVPNFSELQNELERKNMDLEQLELQVKNLEKEITSVKRENSSLKEEQESLRSIKESLKEESELELLEYKKEILLLKEKQLKDFVQEWNLQKEDLSQKYSTDLNRIQREFEKEKLDFNREISRLEAEKDVLQQKLYDVDRKSRKMDFECQTVQEPGNLNVLKETFQRDFERVEEFCDFVKGEMSEKDEIIQNLKREKAYIIQDFTAQKEDFKQKEQAFNCQSEEYKQKQQDLQAQTEALKVKYESELHRNDSFKNLESVLRDYPHVHEEFKNIVFKKVEQALAEQRIKNAEYVDQVLSGHQRQVSELVKNFEAEKEALRMEKNTEIMALSSKLKTTCSDAYSSSISRVQSHLEAEKKSLLQEFEHDKQFFKDLIAKEREAFNLELSRTNQQHSKEIKDLKEKYLVILKQMRTDLVSSKANTLQRMEVEWNKRKGVYEDKLRQLKLQLSSNHMYMKESKDLFL